MYRLFLLYSKGISKEFHFIDKIEILSTAVRPSSSSSLIDTIIFNRILVLLLCSTIDM